MQPEWLCPQPPLCPQPHLTLLGLPQVFCSPVPPAKTSTPEDFIRMTKGITMATAKAVAAGNSCRQEDVIATANLSRRAVADMLRSCKVGPGPGGQTRSGPLGEAGVGGCRALLSGPSRRGRWWCGSPAASCSGC